MSRRKRDPKYNRSAQLAVYLTPDEYKRFHVYADSLPWDSESAVAARIIMAHVASTEKAGQ